MKVKINKQALCESTVLLREFNNADKAELLNNGQDFTVSYEIEMESSDAVDGEGYYLNESDPVEELKDRLNDMGSQEQVEFFGMDDSLREAAGESDASELCSEIVTTTNIDGITDTLAAIIALTVRDKTDRGKQVDDSGDIELVPVVLKESDIESFVLAYILSKESGGQYNTALVDKANNNDEYQKMMKIASDLGVGAQTDFNFSKIREERIGQIMGFTGDEWDLSFIPEGANYSPAKFFTEVLDLPINFYYEELKNLEKTCKQILGNYNNLVGLTNGDYRAGEHDETKNFPEFRKAAEELASLAQYKIDEFYEESEQSFDYRDYGFDLESYVSSNTDSKFEQSGGNALIDYFPTFWKKYGRQMESDADLSLENNHNVEIKMSSYLQGIASALEYLDIFFDDFDNQNNFQFNQNTGLHTNISMDIPNKKFNLLKALFFLSEIEGKQGEVPFAYKGIESRYKNKNWSDTIKDKALKYLKEEFNEDQRLAQTIKESYKNNDFVTIIDELNGHLGDFKRGVSAKHHGFNMKYTETRGYIEFRYPGHNVTKEALEDLTLYYAHIVKASLDPEYKKQEFMKKLVGFLQELFSQTGPNSKQSINAITQQFEAFFGPAKQFSYQDGSYAGGIRSGIDYADYNEFPYSQFMGIKTLDPIFAEYPLYKSKAIAEMNELLPINIKKAISILFPGEKLFEHFGAAMMFLSNLALTAKNTNAISVRERDSVEYFLRRIRVTMRDGMRALFEKMKYDAIKAKEQEETSLTESKKKVKIIKRMPLEETSVAGSIQGAPGCNGGPWPSSVANSGHSLPSQAKKKTILRRLGMA